MENLDNTIEQPEILLEEETPESNKRQKGQALIEFTLTIPILLLIMLGIIDFGRIFFTYAQAASAIRDGARFAAVLGYGTNQPYLDCDGMRAAVGDFWFADSTTITVQYELAADGTILNCPSNGIVQDSDLVNGDMLQISLNAQITLIAYSNLTLDLNFFAQRTIVKTLEIGADFDDSDYDGLADTWEDSYFGGIGAHVATDDPDSDGCNNGCEEIRGSDPNVDDTLADPAIYPDGFFPVPSPTYNFTLTVTCTSNAITALAASWDTISPAPTRVEIRDATDDSLVHTFNSPSSASGGAFSPAVIVDPEVYYAVVVQEHPTQFGTPPNVYPQSLHSPDRTATCLPPAQPIGLNASPDCTLGQIDFTWTAFSLPQPDTIEIRRKSDDSVVYNTSDGSLTFCTDCGGSIGTNDSITFYMVSIINGIESTPSADAIALCGTGGFPTGTANLSGRVWWDDNENDKQGGNEDDLGGVTVTITYYGPDGNPGTGDESSIVQVTSASGLFSISGIQAGNYQVDVTLPAGYVSAVYYDPDDGDMYSGLSSVFALSGTVNGHAMGGGWSGGEFFGLLD